MLEQIKNKLLRELLREEQEEYAWSEEKMVKVTRAADIRGQEQPEAQNALSCAPCEAEEEEDREREILRQFLETPIVRRGNKRFRPTRRFCRLPVRIAAMAALGLFFFTSNPMRMVAEAAAKTSGAFNVSVSEWESGVTLTDDVVLTMDEPFTVVGKIELNGRTLTIQGAGGTLTVTNQISDVSDSGTLIVDEASVSSTGSTFGINVGNLELKNGASVSAKGADGGAAFKIKYQPVGVDESPDGQLLATPGYWTVRNAADNGNILTATLRNIIRPATANKTAVAAQPAHTHAYDWFVIREATAEEDGEMDYMCKGCGHVLYRIPLTGYYVFNAESMNKIQKAGQGATVEISTNRWISFHRMVMDALAARPDVTLTVNFLSEGHKGEAMSLTIPAGTDTVSLLDANGYSGFQYLRSRLAATP